MSRPAASLSSLIETRQELVSAKTSPPLTYCVSVDVKENKHCEIVRPDVLDVYSRQLCDARSLTRIRYVFPRPPSSSRSRPWSRGRGGQASVSQGPDRPRTRRYARRQRPLASAAAMDENASARGSPRPPCLPLSCGAHRHCSTARAARRGATGLQALRTPLLQRFGFQQRA